MMKSSLTAPGGRTSTSSRFTYSSHSGYRSPSMSRGTEAPRGTTPNEDPGRDPAGTARKGKKRILVVDDEKDLVDLIGYNLQRNGYEALTSFNGNTALEVAAREQPDLIVLDLMLPGLDGTEV